MPDMKKCPICEGGLNAQSLQREVKVGSRTAEVLDQFFVCEQCGEEIYLPGQMDATLKRASEKIRTEEGLLLPDEIRMIREDLGLTQGAFEELLGVGPKTAVRWEKGTVFQNSATDSLLRLIRDVPNAAEYLARLHGVELPGPGPMESSQPIWAHGATHLTVRGSKSQESEAQFFGKIPVGPSGKVRIGRA